MKTFQATHCPAVISEPVSKLGTFKALTSGCAALLSAPSDASWPPRSDCWPTPSGERASSPQQSSRSRWDLQKDKWSPNRN